MKRLIIQYLLSVLPGPVDVVAPGYNNWKLQMDQQLLSKVKHNSEQEEQLQLNLTLYLSQ